MLTFPRQYRIPLIVGIVVGFSQGVISIFFERFICNLTEDESTRLYCQEKIYNPDHMMMSMFLLNIFTIGPTALFICKLEKFGRRKLFIFGFIATLLTLIIIQGFARWQSKSEYFEINTMVIQGLLLFYTIIVYSATLGPT